MTPVTPMTPTPARPPRGALFALLVATMCAARLAGATVHDVGGSQYGNGHFHWEKSLWFSGTYAQYRVPMPTAYTLSDATNINAVIGSTVEVRGCAYQPLQGNIIPYNTGYTNSGVWIQVINPAPGIPCCFTVTIDVDATSSCNAYGLRGDVTTFGYNTVSYTRDDPVLTPYIDAGSGVIQQALATTLADSRWASGVLQGNRGTVEKILLGVASLPGNGNSSNSTGATAGEIWGAQGGDCDDLSKLACALLRRAGVPSRVVLCGNLGVPAAVPFGPSRGAPELHAYAEYWNGDEWESFEPSFGFENFASADNVVLGMDEDFSGLYPQAAPAGYTYPITGGDELAAGTWSEGWNGFSDRGARVPLCATTVFAQPVDFGPHGHHAYAPTDVLQPLGSAASVGPAEARAGGLLLVPIDRGTTWGGGVRVSGLGGGAAGLELLDVQGRRLSRLPVPPGTPDGTSFEVRVPAAAGVYFARLRQGARVATVRVIRLR